MDLIGIAAYELAELYQVATANILSNTFLSSLLFKNFLYCFHVSCSKTAAILKDGIIRPDIRFGNMIEDN